MRARQLGAIRDRFLEVLDGFINVALPKQEVAQIAFRLAKSGRHTSACLNSTTASLIGPVLSSAAPRLLWVSALPGLMANDLR